MTFTQHAGQDEGDLGSGASADEVLHIRNLDIRYGDGDPTVRNVDLTVKRGEIVGLIGESGSGKSTVALACAGLLPKTAHVTADELSACGRDLLRADRRDWTRIRGGLVGMIFQDAMGALDPTMRIGNQIGEAIGRHRGVKGKERAAAVLELLGKVGIPEPERQARQYPHQLSGGLRQRVAIALALAGDPEVLLADEPTTALDVTVQAGILDLFRSIRDEFGVAIVLISHDMGVIAQTADRVAVMLDGEVVEQGDVSGVLLDPASSYTRMLLDAMPRITPPAPGARAVATAPSREDVLFSVDDVSRTYRSRGAEVRAVRGVSLDVRRGEVLGIVGESGSGKSTLARMLARLEQPTSGRLALGDLDYRDLRRRRARRFRRAVQMVFQHPKGSLNPRLRIGTSVSEPLSGARLRDTSAMERAREVIAKVGLPAESLRKFPHEFSGGQAQRIAIARAIVGSPQAVILDEPTSALDVSVQAQVLDLLAGIREDGDLTYIFISHDLAVVQQISDRVAVMYAGQVVEVAETEQLFRAPAHWYTKALLAAVPSPDPRDRPDHGRDDDSGPAEGGADPAGQRREAARATPAEGGCAFAARCPHAGPTCLAEAPALRLVGPGHLVACHTPDSAEPAPALAAAPAQGRV